MTSTEHGRCRQGRPAAAAAGAPPEPPAGRGGAPLMSAETRRFLCAETGRIGATRTNAGQTAAARGKQEPDRVQSHPARNRKTPGRAVASRTGRPLQEAEIAAAPAVFPLTAARPADGSAPPAANQSTSI